VFDFVDLSPESYIVKGCNDHARCSYFIGSIIDSMKIRICK